MNCHVIYLYCLSLANRLTVSEWTGVEGNPPVFLHRFGDLVAVLSGVPLVDFSGEAGERNLSDMSWVGPRALRHGEVIWKASHCSPVLPLRFGAIFSSLEVMERFLGSHHGSIVEFLQRTAGQEDWSVKGVIDRPAVKRSILAIRLSDEERRLASFPPGRRHLEEQRLQGRVESLLNGWLEDVCRRLTADLERHATDFRQRRILPHASEGKEAVVNLAFLLHRDEVAAFRARIERANSEFAPQGLTFQHSGPWPPYSFTPELAAVEEPGAEVSSR